MQPTSINIHQKGVTRRNTVIPAGQPNKSRAQKEKKAKKKIFSERKH